MNLQELFFFLSEQARAVTCNPGLVLTLLEYNILLFVSSIPPLCSVYSTHEDQQRQWCLCIK